MSEVTEQSATPETEHETPAGKVSVGESVRAAMAKAVDTPVETTETPEKKEVTDETKAEKTRAPDGKFAKKDSIEGAEGQDSIDPDPKPAVPVVRAPQSLKGELKAKFSELAPEWQTEIDRLEREAKKQIQTNGEAANFGRSLYAEIQPYEAMIRAEGGTPQGAVRDLLRTAYVLRSGTPAQKQQAIMGVAQQFGIDLSGIAQGQVPQVDPNVAALHQEVERLKRERQQEVQQRTHQETTQVQSAIEKFASDPKHEHFDDVRVHMGVLMETGAADTLENAYEQACWANPTIRQKLIQSQQAEAEAKRKADERKAVEAKRNAGVSIKGAPAAPIGAASGKKESVGETLRRVSAQAQGRI